jgi:hypothetical protein
VSAGSRVRVTRVLSAALVLLGLVLIVETAVLGSGVGLLLGALFLLAGGLRLYLSFR